MRWWVRDDDANAGYFLPSPVWHMLRGEVRDAEAETVEYPSESQAFADLGQALRAAHKAVPQLEGEAMAIPTVTREEYLRAVTEGVRRAVADALPFTELILMAVGDGVKEAFGGAIRNGTDMPTADILDSIRQGVKDAVVELRSGR